MPGGKRSREPWRPTREQLEAARDTKVRDLIAPGLRVLFVGINPGLYTAAVGHHFARPGNRFWPTLAAAGFTEGVVSPFDEDSLLELGLGITNVVARASARADELTPVELVRGAAILARKVRRCRPYTVAVLGVTAYRAAFARPKAKLGRQTELIEGSHLWVLPNPSGLNAHHQLADLAKSFGQLRSFAAK